MTKALEILKEIQQKKPFIYSVTSVWCRTIITNEPTRINEAIAELEALQQPKSCKSCRFYHSYTGVCANDKCPLCADFVNSDFGCIHYDAKDLK